MLAAAGEPTRAETHEGGSCGSDRTLSTSIRSRREKSHTSGFHPRECSIRLGIDASLISTAQAFSPAVDLLVLQPVTKPFRFAVSTISGSPRRRFPHLMTPANSAAFGSRRA